MGRLKWFDRFLTSEIVAQNRFLSRRRRKNRFLRPIKEITSTMGSSPGLLTYFSFIIKCTKTVHLYDGKQAEL